MVGGDFQKSLQLLVTYGCCVFEDDVCVDPSGVPNERPNYANITFLELFAGPCIYRLKVMDEGPDFSTAHFFRVLCWGYLPPLCWRLLGLRRPRSQVERKENFKQDNADFFFFDFPFFLFLFLFF